MPSLPKCEDLISPGLELGQYEDRIIKELARGMQQGETPESVLKRLLEDSKLKNEEEKFIQYGSLVFSRIEEPQIREKYNRQILELRRQRNEAQKNFEQEGHTEQEVTRRYKDSLQEVEREARRRSDQYIDQIKNALSGVQPTKDYTQSKGPNIPFLSWLSRLHRRILNKYYALRGYDPATAGTELSYLLTEMRNSNRSGV